MSQYARDIKHILATLNEHGGEDDTSLPDEEELDTIHVYPVEGGGILLTRTPLEDDEAAAPPVIDSQDDYTTTAPGAQIPPLFLLFLLLLCLFVVGDLADNQVIALMTPTATITITPEVRNITFQSTATLGKLLSPITLTESQTVPTTGHGHQDARQAAGTLTFYNGLSTVQQVAAGTLITGQDGSSVATDTFITIPSANPPSLGETSVPAHAVQTGTAGNIQAGDMNATLSSGLYVKNLAAFTGGQDERDYLLVTKSDRDTAAATLQAKVTASMTAALHGQLMPGQELHPLPCPPSPCHRRRSCARGGSNPCDRHRVRNLYRRCLRHATVAGQDDTAYDNSSSTHVRRRLRTLWQPAGECDQSDSHADHIRSSPCLQLSGNVCLHAQWTSTATSQSPAGWQTPPCGLTLALAATRDSHSQHHRHCG